MATRPGNSSIGQLHVAIANDAPRFTAYGLEWQRLAGVENTLGTHDLFEVTGPDAAGMPLRISAADEAIYVIEGTAALTCNGEKRKLDKGTFAYLPTGSAFEWRTCGPKTHLLVFHLPGGFDRAIAGADGHDDYLRSWLKAEGTHFL